jgi:hypothetical protein
VRRNSTHIFLNLYKNRLKAGLQPNQNKKGATEAAPFVSKSERMFLCLLKARPRAHESLLELRKRSTE